jgi:DNA-binding MarR family transcriptional regulator
MPAEFPALRVGSDTYEPETGYTAWLVKRAERRAAASMYDELRALGLTPAQFGVLAALRQLGRATLAELARTQFVTPQAMTGLVAGLERLGYVRRRDQTPARITLAALTARGRAAFDAAALRVRAVDDTLTSGLAADEVADLRRLLERCLDAFDGRH